MNERPIFRSRFYLSKESACDGLIRWCPALDDLCCQRPSYILRLASLMYRRVVEFYTSAAPLSKWCRTQCSIMTTWRSNVTVKFGDGTRPNYTSSSSDPITLDVYSKATLHSVAGRDLSLYSSPSRHFTCSQPTINRSRSTEAASPHCDLVSWLYCSSSFSPDRGLVEMLARL